MRTCSTRRLAALTAALSILLLSGATSTVGTTNFTVTARDTGTARQVAQVAERVRVEIAQLWLGQSLPDWSRPCPIRVKITQGGAGGATTFEFRDRGVVDQEIQLEGRLDRILASALPHEVTHTIFASVFGGPLPRWADEGASLLSEDRYERDLHDRIARDRLGQGRAWPLTKLFTVDRYPRDLIGFYGQGYSVSRFLVEIGGRDGRPRFLKFLRHGQRHGWDQAVRTHYGFTDTRELDHAWQAWNQVTLAQHGSPSTSARQGQVVRSLRPSSTTSPVAALDFRLPSRPGQPSSILTRSSDQSRPVLRVPSTSDQGRILRR